MVGRLARASVRYRYMYVYRYVFCISVADDSVSEDYRGARLAERFRRRAEIVAPDEYNPRRLMDKAWKKDQSAHEGEVA